MHERDATIGSTRVSQVRPPSGTPHPPQTVPELFRGFLTESTMTAASIDFRMTLLSVLVAEIQIVNGKSSTFCFSATTADTDLNRVLKIMSRCDLDSDKQLRPPAVDPLAVQFRQ